MHDRRFVRAASMLLGAYGAIFCYASYGQDGSAVSPVAPAQTERTQDEIVVVGRRTMTSLMNDAATATEDFYEILNGVLDNDDWRIDCTSQRPTGSSIAIRVCTTRFYERAMARQAASVRESFGTDPDGVLIFDGTIVDVSAEILFQQREFERAMLEAVNTYPELNAQAKKLIDLKAMIENYETPAQQRRRERRERREARAGG